MKTIALFGMAMVLSTVGCSVENARVRTHLNGSAALTGTIPVNPLQWRVITSSADQQHGTMSTLFGNDPAVEHARSSTHGDYPAGSMLSLVTWRETEDPRWFGGRIPQEPLSVEYVTVTSASGQQPSSTYQKFEGNPLKEVSNGDKSSQADRVDYLLSQRAAVMP